MLRNKIKCRARACFCRQVTTKAATVALPYHTTFHELRSAFCILISTKPYKKNTFQAVKLSQKVENIKILLIFSSKSVIMYHK